MFLIGYAIGQSLFGRVFDAIGTRLGFVAAIVVWSVSVALHAITRTLMGFSIVRFVMGVAEAGNWPGATKSNAEWFPIRERALAQGIFNAGASVGALVSAPLVGLLWHWIGWKATFVVLGALGFVWLVPWLVVYLSGPEKPSVADRRRTRAHSHRPAGRAHRRRSRNKHLRAGGGGKCCGTGKVGR